MAYDEGLAERIRGALDHLRGVSERKMFGGLAFMVRGHMAVGIVRDELMVRAGPQACAWLAGKPHVRAMDFTGRPMKGFLFVEASGLEDDHDLTHWIGHGVEYALSLPPKALPPGTLKEDRPSRTGKAVSDRAGARRKR